MAILPKTGPILRMLRPSPSATDARFLRALPPRPAETHKDGFTRLEQPDLLLFRRVGFGRRPRMAAALDEAVDIRLRSDGPIARWPERIAEFGIHYSGFDVVPQLGIDNRANLRTDLFVL